jgi:heat shock protein HslJ
MRNIFIAYILVFLVAYCQSSGRRDDKSTKDTVFINTDTLQIDTTAKKVYFFTSYDVSKAPIPENVTLSWQKQKGDESYLRLTGMGHLNQYDATYVIDGDGNMVKNVEFISTQLASSDSTVISAEAEFFKNLKEARKISLGDKEVKIHSGEKEVLTFKK